MASLCMASQCSGNTKPSHTKARNFQITLNEVDKWENLKEYLMQRKLLNYALACKETAPTTGHEHIHCYCQFSNSTALAISKLQGAHIEKCMGTPQENVNYIRKDGNIIWEYGEIRITGNPTIRNIKQMQPEEVDDLPWQMHNTATKIIEEQREIDGFMDMLDEIEKDTLAAPDVIYIIGQPGEGKTYGAYKLALQMFPKQEIGRIKFCNQFATITNKNAKCFVIEEFRASDLRASELLQLLDKYGTNVNTKGGFCYVRAKCIIICSIFQPDELYQHDELCEQFERRITKMYKAVDHELEQIK